MQEVFFFFFGETFNGHQQVLLFGAIYYKETLHKCRKLKKKICNNNPASLQLEPFLIFTLIKNTHTFLYQFNTLNHLSIFFLGGGRNYPVNK